MELKTKPIYEKRCTIAIKKEGSPFYTLLQKEKGLAFDDYATYPFGKICIYGSYITLKLASGILKINNEDIICFELYRAILGSLIIIRHKNETMQKNIWFATIFSKKTFYKLKSACKKNNVYFRFIAK